MKFINCITISICFCFVSCVYIYTEIKPGHIAQLKLMEPRQVKVSTKVHLVDGSLIIFKKGFIVLNDSLKGEGMKYNFTRGQNHRIYGESFDNIVRLDYYKNRGGWSTFLVSVVPDFIVCVPILALWAHILDII